MVGLRFRRGFCVGVFNIESDDIASCFMNRWSMNKAVFKQKVGYVKVEPETAYTTNIIN
jgi:hypothetical protein